MWGGRVYEPLKDFIIKNQDIDIFCFQEVYHHVEDKESDFVSEVAAELFKDLENWLPNHSGFFRPHAGDFWGLAMFIKKSLPVLEEGELFVYKYKGWSSSENKHFFPKNIQYIKTKVNNKEITIVNFHGHWTGKGKSDTEDRLLQSENIISFLKSIEKPYVLCGDFNLLPDTESVKKFEDFGLRNLIKEYNITSTRTSYYKKPIRYADYVFASEDINIKRCEVLPEEISDHSTILLEIEK
jgi:endonuclease/exonuclease/phosphatase family metal-dependent hydrolase